MGRAGVSKQESCTPLKDVSDLGDATLDMKGRRVQYKVAVVGSAMEKSCTESCDCNVCLPAYLCSTGRMPPHIFVRRGYVCFKTCARLPHS